MDKLIIGDFTILPGEQRKIELPVAKLYTDADVSLPVHIIRAKKPGPTIFISAAVHGDELNGIEIIRRLIKQNKFKITSGTLIAVPMVNVYGVVNQSRYMPDRRDLNRCFPGSAKGSLAGRVAHIFLNEIVRHCDYGIDLHTGAIHRSNFPQIRADMDDEETKLLAEVFGVPVILNSNLVDGSLRESAVKNETKILLYEAGEALRFDEFSIRAGMKGILNVLQHLGMIRKSSSKAKKKRAPFIANGSQWVRANASGIVHNIANLGEQITKGQVLAEIGSPYGEVIDSVIASRSGILIGKQNIPLVQEGEAMFHIAYFSENDEKIAEHIENVQEQLLPDSVN
ncbi:MULTISPECIES: succinylglutamate desuccinylase/aspartoacylase family protein [unclassified Shewanella]|uniref:succinylglutamate desuccinylase/aspartoacylase family protein n=1 Tax=unclassified Shewanella TaxID=196818 RepID=UPI000C8279B4|nr:MULTISPECIES: succinylglutamate desuccinylase/aspartoacylase family protein [unclassified Shewanella]MDO6776438.1 succinylglutamate desuccinylase/aspartoacylase family protein [Shewanella sp. 3_MG-2023]PMH89377.1 succinylglutamate desuccinylase [Shewanella sp. 10N.286.48.B5]